MEDVWERAEEAKQDINEIRDDYLDYVQDLASNYNSTRVPVNATENIFNAKDPIWIDDVWVDTVVVVGLTCFILCLMGLSKVRISELTRMYRQYA